jgi:hypothetical protein
MRSMWGKKKDMSHLSVLIFSFLENVPHEIGKGAGPVRSIWSVFDLWGIM